MVHGTVDTIDDESDDDHDDVTAGSSDDNDDSDDGYIDVLGIITHNWLLHLVSQQRKQSPTPDLAQVNIH